MTDPRQPHLAGAAALMRIDWVPVWLMAPAGLLMSALLLYPILRGIVLSFFNTRLLRFDQGRYVGLANYEDLLVDPSFWNSLQVTLLYALGTVICTYLAGLGLALLLDRRMPARGLLRTLFVLPWAIPEIVIVLIFAWMLDAQFGVINYLLVELSILDRPAAWLSESRLALVVVILVTTWQQFPLAMLILLAGLQTIPAEQYEAAKVDGAGAWARFRYVTLPGLRAVNVVLMLLLVLNSFRRVTILYTMTGGGPAGATETLSVLTYTTAFQYQKIGYAAAIGTVLLLLLLGFSMVFVRLTRRGEDA